MSESLREEKLTAGDKLTTMLSCVELGRTGNSQVEREEAKVRALSLAVEILHAPEEERKRVAEKFGLTASLNPDLAKAGYKTLLGAKVLEAAVLRKMLGISRHKK